MKLKTATRAAGKRERNCKNASGAANMSEWPPPFTFSFLLRAWRHLHLVPAGKIKLVIVAPTHVRHECSAHVLVIGEGCIWSAHGDGEQEHVFGMRLAGQGGQQILRLLRRHKWDWWGKRNVLQKWFPVFWGTPTSAPGLSWSASSSWKTKADVKVGEGDRICSVRHVVPSPPVQQLLLPLPPVPSLPSLPPPLVSSPPNGEVSGGGAFSRVPLSPSPSFLSSPSPSHP